MIDAALKGTRPGHLAISVVIPILNEAPTLEELHRRLTGQLRLGGYEYELILVDDGSTDPTPNTVRKLRALDPRIKYIRFRRNFGKSAALAAGFRAARYDTIATMDGDLQDVPECLP